MATFLCSKGKFGNDGSRGAVEYGRTGMTRVRRIFGEFYVGKCRYFRSVVFSFDLQTWGAEVESCELSFGGWLVAAG